MQHHLIKSAMCFQILLYSNFRKMTSQLREVFLLLSTGHLFGLYNPNQVADALAIPKASLYRPLVYISGNLYWCVSDVHSPSLKSGMSNQRVLPHALVVALQSVWMIQMIHAMVNYCPTATNGGLKNITTQSEAEMC